jgi:hypothetical protein
MKFINAVVVGACGQDGGDRKCAQNLVGEPLKNDHM